MGARTRKYKQLVPGVASQIGAPDVESDWVGVDAVLPILERMRADGAVVVVKFDGERGLNDNGAYTAIASGPPPREDFVRVDEHALEDALAYVIVRYAQTRWGYSPPHVV